MPLIVDGVTISQVIGEADVIVNGEFMDEVIYNGQLVWQKKVAAGTQTFTASGTFTVPQGIYTINVCMVGGGGGGSHKHTSQGHAYGGKAGTAAQYSIPVTPGEELSIVVGARGIGGAYPNGLGTAGTASSVTAVSGVYEAAGGLGSAYAGYLQAVVSLCNGITYYAGTRNTSYNDWGGQGGTFGNGGRGNVCTNSGCTAPVNSGAGGGGVICDNSSGSRAGYGGTGRVILSWD